MSGPSIDPKWFRQVLSQYPTGVSVITSMGEGGQPVGLTVGSFTSVSIDPPLVAFLPGRGSQSWKAIEQIGRFCVNILGSDQEWICRQFATKGDEKFIGVPYRLSPGGSPVIENCVAWIDCELGSVVDAGDHVFVMGNVEKMHIESGDLPLLFYQGGYGRFMPLSLAAPDPLGMLAEPLRQVDTIRLEMERVANDLDSRCVAMARIGDELVVVASAGIPHLESLSTWVGLRLPFIPPIGSIFAAWDSEFEKDAWIAKAPPEAKAAYSELLSLVRTRGYAVGLLNDAHRAFLELARQVAGGRVSFPDEEIGGSVEDLAFDPQGVDAGSESRIARISAPIFDRDGNVALMLMVSEFANEGEGTSSEQKIDRFLQAVACSNEKLRAGAEGHVNLVGGSGSGALRKTNKGEV